MTKYVIIVAGGKGLRMGSDVPKQFLHLCGKPVLMHTIEAFYRYDNQIGIIVVLPSEQRDYWMELCEKHDFTIPHQIANGGKDRFHSVKNGLEAIGNTWKKIQSERINDSLVAVHDGVRPLILQETIARCFDAAEEKGAAFPGIPVVDTLRKKVESGSVLVDRNDYLLVQTPQVFRMEILKRAYEQEFSEHFTDDVSVVEALGIQVFAVDGNRGNIKITTIEDLVIAEGLRIKN